VRPSVVSPPCSHPPAYLTGIESDQFHQGDVAEQQFGQRIGRGNAQEDAGSIQEEKVSGWQEHPVHALNDEGLPVL